MTATNASYWCSVFAIAYAIGLIFPGILIYRSYRSAGKQVPIETQNVPKQFIGIVLLCLIAGSWASKAFLDSDFFASSVGNYVFTVFEAVVLAQFIPIGIALYFDTAIEADSPAAN